MISVGIDVSKGKVLFALWNLAAKYLNHPLTLVTLPMNWILLFLSSNHSMKKPVLLWKIQVTIIFLLRPIYLLTTFCMLCKCLAYEEVLLAKHKTSKTDKIDSIKIASFGITYWNELVKAYPSNVIYDELKFLARQYYQVTGMLVKSKVNFSNLLDQVMPKSMMFFQIKVKITSWPSLSVDIFIFKIFSIWEKWNLHLITANGQRKGIPLKRA